MFLLTGKELLGKKEYIFMGNLTVDGVKPRVVTDAAQESTASTKPAEKQEESIHVTAAKAEKAENT